MKKILKFFLMFSIYCLSSSSGVEDQQRAGATNPPLAISTSTSNKVPILLIEEKFSNAKEIDYNGLEKCIRYSFKDRQLLRDALHPLLSEGLSSNEKFNRLEFLGDSVLGFVIKERLLALLPEISRGDIAQLYSSMTSNRTLTDIYFRNLEIEQYLPFPGKKYCEVCNVVESLIGGIHLDDPEKGFVNSKKFIVYILNDHILKEKIDEYSSSKGVEITIGTLPYQEETINNICTPERRIFQSPKTLLQEILTRLWGDNPNYKNSMKEKDGVVCYLATVSGAQIGNTIQGEGCTKQESEEDAAREAINFLALKELLPRKDIRIPNKSYTSRLIEHLGMSGKVCRFENVTPSIKEQVIFKGKVIAEGIGSSIEEAKDAATEKACHYFKDPSFISHEGRAHGSKSYWVLLNEFFDLVQHKGYNVTPLPSQQGFAYQVEFKSRIIGNGVGSSKRKAKEQASENAFLFLRNEDLENHISSVQLFLIFKGSDYPKLLTYQQIFTYQVKVKDEVLGEGEGVSADEAKEQAARNAYEQLIEKEKSEIERREELREKFRSSASEISEAKLKKRAEGAAARSTYKQELIGKEKSEIERQEELKEKFISSAPEASKPKLMEKAIKQDEIQCQEKSKNHQHQNQKKKAKKSTPNPSKASHHHQHLQGLH